MLVYLTAIIELVAGINEHVAYDKLAKEWKIIDIFDIFFEKFNSASQVFHMLRSASIDEEYPTGKTTRTAVSIFPYRFGAGSNRIILVDFQFNQVVERRVRIST